MVDRVGLPPDLTKHLYAVTELRLDTSALCIKTLDVGERGGRAQLGRQPKLEPLSMVKSIQGQTWVFAMEEQDELRLELELPDARPRLRTVWDLLRALGGTTA